MSSYDESSCSEEEVLAPPSSLPARRARLTTDKVVVCRDLLNPAKSVIVPTEALGLRAAPRSRAAGAVAGVPLSEHDVSPESVAPRAPLLARPRTRKRDDRDSDDDSEPSPANTEKRADYRSSPSLSSDASTHRPRATAAASVSATSPPSAGSPGLSARYHTDTPASPDDASWARVGPGRATMMTSSPNTLSRETGSTSYAALDSVPLDAAPMPSPPPPAAHSYAAAAASPPRSQASSPRAPTQPDPVACTAKGGAYPPIVVECLPDWPMHLAKLRQIIGHIPSARPHEKGIRFRPKTPEEYRAIQAYLVNLETTTPDLSWFCYSLESQKPHKVALWGLPQGTDGELIVADLKRLGFPARFARSLPLRPNARKATYHVQFDPMSRVELERLYQTEELLNMPRVEIEAWRGHTTMPQCHRCQQFGHASPNCHRPQRCVKCAGPHFGSECTKAAGAPPQCANCKGPHAANSRQCAVFRREARKREVRIPGNRRAPPPPPSAPGTGAEPPTDHHPRPPPPARAAPTALAPPAAPVPTAPRGGAPTADAPAARPSRRRRTRRGRKRAAANKPGLPAAPPPPREPAATPAAAQRPPPQPVDAPRSTPVPGVEAATQPHPRATTAPTQSAQPTVSKAVTRTATTSTVATATATQPRTTRSAPRNERALGGQRSEQRPQHPGSRQYAPPAQQQQWAPPGFGFMPEFAGPQHPMYGVTSGPFFPRPMVGAAGAYDEPIGVLMGALVGLLAAIAAGEDLREAARRGLAAVRNIYG